MNWRAAKHSSGFTLLEVLVTLAILGIGVALALSLISGALANIRKVQLRTRTMHYAETVMELSLLDDSIKKPTTLRGDFEDGTRWSVDISEFEMPRETTLSTQQTEMPFKLLAYSVEIYGRESQTADFRLRTLKMVSALEQERGPQPLGPPQLPQ